MRLDKACCERVAFTNQIFGWAIIKYFFRLCSCSAVWFEHGV